MFLKRLFDLFVSLVGIIVLLPVFLIIALLVKIKTPGPLFFVQQRVGRYGKLFRLVKFRTMLAGQKGNNITVKGESRITPLGAFLRKYKLDELPELWNVLKGDMSFVGPRPDVPGYADRLKGEERKILELRPGITGPASMKYSNEEELLAQQPDPVKYNNEVIWPDKVRINLEYLRNRNFRFDLKMIIYTVLGKNPEGCK
ncbi:MAG: sugar transferase [Bacteroidales bacterium]|nr:sugar transferase [Bacteroidales bacterium]